MSPTIVNGNIKNKMGWVVVGGGGGYSVRVWWSFIRWGESIVVCQLRVVLSNYQSNLIINKEVMAILAKLNNLTLRVKVIQRSR